MSDKNLWIVLRVALAGLILAHGWYRFLNGGVEPFGGFLDSKGFKVGEAIAWAITIFEMVAPVLLIVGRYVFPVALVCCFIYAMGIWLVHAQNGWFVVGGGR